MCRSLAFAVAMCGFVVAADANVDDSLAAVGTGGLMFEKADRISVQREDLLISVDEIRVRYEFRNDSGVPFTGHVAFPLPPVSPGLIMHSNSAFSTGDPVEWLDFHLTLNGIPMSPTPRIWATADGREGEMAAAWAPTLFLHDQRYSRNSVQNVRRSSRFVKDCGPTEVRYLECGQWHPITTLRTASILLGSMAPRAPS